VLLLTSYLLDKVDEDGNGTLDLNEFMQASSLLAVVAK
jgi:Ca2+-binding EF-hand superfamily protein|tara:strand:- start:362 stop:475 length:114 start_codon:yes stop_codon:yes gene_type:complete